MRFFKVFSHYYLKGLLRQRGHLFHAWGFFALICALFPLAIGAEEGLLPRVGAGVLWVALLLSATLSVHLLFDDDYRDGTLEILLMKRWHIESLVLSRFIVHWLAFVLPLLALVPLMMELLHLHSHHSFPPLSAAPSSPLVLTLVTMSLGGLILTALSTLGAVLTLGLKHRGGLTHLLILPLMIPVLIFGVAGSGALPLTGNDALLPITALVALAFTYVPITILLSAFSLRHLVLR